VKEKIPLLDHPDAPPVDYKHWLKLEELGQETQIPEGVSEPINVKQLLDRVEPEQERRDRRQSRTEPRAKPQPPPAEQAQQPTSVKAGLQKSGLFYLIVFAVGAGIFISAQMLRGWIAATSAIVAGVVILSVVGAFQLRQDDKLNEKHFLKLMGISLRQMALLKGIGSSEKSAKK